MKKNNKKTPDNKVKKINQEKWYDNDLIVNISLITIILIIPILIIVGAILLLILIFNFDIVIGIFLGLFVSVFISSLYYKILTAFFKRNTK